MTDNNRKSIYIALAIIVSVALWTFVVYNFDPMTEVKYTDVAVEFAGEQELADRGLAISDVSTDGVTVTLSQRRADTGRITADDIKIIADVESCVAGSNSIELSISGPENTTVVSSDKHLVDINVDRTKTEEIDIDVLYKGDDIEEGMEPVATDLSQTEAEVICTAERMKEIKSIAALLNYENVDDTVKSYTTKLVALDKKGKMLPHVVIYPEEISLDAFAGVTKKVKLSVPVKTESDDNYEIKYTVPDSIMIKGLASDLKNIDTIKAEEVDLEDVFEDGETEIEYILPEGIFVADASLGQKIKYTVTYMDEE